MKTDKLRSLSICKNFFTTLDVPEEKDLCRYYRGEFIGPLYWRKSIPLQLTLFGMRGWWGKSFSGNGMACNLILYKNKLADSIPISVSEESSDLDGNPCLKVKYPSDARFPWPYITDELRKIDDKTLMGMTRANLPGLKNTGFPFLLHAEGELEYDCGRYKS